MKPAEKITETLKAHKDNLRDGYGVAEIGLFDSYVRGTQNASGDVDILAEFRRAVGLLAFVRLKNRLTDLPGIRVDLTSAPGTDSEALFMQPI